jgi:kinetochore protein NDC80
MSKSQISAVGSMHAWPAMLAMLNWMVDINLVDPYLVCPLILKVSEKLLSGEIVPEEFDNNFPERVFFDYLADAYNQFFAGKDDFSDSERQLEQQFDNRNAERLADIERLQEENDQLVKELTQLNFDAVTPPPTF